MELSVKKPIQNAGISEKSETSKLKSTVSVDDSLLEMVRLLPVSERTTEFAEKLNQGFENLVLDVRLCRHLLQAKDYLGIDRLAQKMSENALKIGASGVLSRSVELQSLARMKNHQEIENKLEEVDEDLIGVKKKLSPQFI